MKRWRAKILLQLVTKADYIIKIVPVSRKLSSPAIWSGMLTGANFRLYCVHWISELLQILKLSERLKMSNSKLTSTQKDVRKAYLEMIHAQGGAIATSEDGRVTVAFEPEFKGSRMLRVGVSVASPDEQKIRAKVGEYHALANLFSDFCIKVPDGTNMYALAEVIAGTQWGF